MFPEPGSPGSRLRAERCPGRRVARRDDPPARFALRFPCAVLHRLRSCARAGGGAPSQLRGARGGRADLTGAECHTGVDADIDVDVDARDCGADDPSSPPRGAAHALDRQSHTTRGDRGEVEARGRRSRVAMSRPRAGRAMGPARWWHVHLPRRQPGHVPARRGAHQEQRLARVGAPAPARALRA